MKDFFIRDKSSLFLINRDEITLTKLWNFFSPDISRTIYVIEQDKLYGIITFGDFKRHYFFTKNFQLINKNFQYINIDAMDSAEYIFKSYHNISTLPVINSNLNICYELVKQTKINGSTKHINPYKKEYNILSYCIYKEWQLLSHVSPDDNEIFELFQHSNLCSIFITTNYIEYLLQSFINIINLYNKIAIFDDLYELIKDKISNNQIYIVKIEDFRWDEKDNCLKNEAIDDTIEIILSCFLYKPHNVEYVSNSSKKIPLMSVYSQFTEFYHGSDYDIVHNILPKLEEYNIDVLVLEEPFDSELKNITYKKNFSRALKDNDTDIKNFLRYENINSYIKEYDNINTININGYLQYADHSGDCFNILGGIRKTIGNNVNNSKKIYMFGPCNIFGIFSSDKHTISSYLQEKLKHYNVVNYGNIWSTISLRMRQCIYHQNDIIIIYAKSRDIYHQHNIQTYSLVEIYNNNNISQNIWDSHNHYNALINKYIANYIYTILQKNILTKLYSTRKSDLKINFNLSNKIYNENLNHWIESIKSNTSFISKEATIGCIVMNCNPFTLGHLYLIEYAQKQVDFLYLFILEEDKSFFSFKDRINMVKEGTKHLKNTFVFSSGSFIISSTTMPGYFEKDTLQDVILDATTDLHIFASTIASSLNIKVRFAGKEPIDKFTNQYNQAMKQLLPQYGIRFLEIERKQLDTQVISASLVRLHLKNKQFDEIKKLVPISTYNYIMHNL